MNFLIKIKMYKNYTRDEIATINFNTVSRSFIIINNVNFNITSSTYSKVHAIQVECVLSKGCQ